MNTGTISLRYAEALYQYAKEQKAETAVYDNMRQLKTLLRAAKGLPVILKDPSMNGVEKVRLLCAALDKPSPVFERFASLVVKASREDVLLYIAYSYINIYREEKKVVSMKITTATPLNDALRKKIESMVENMGATDIEIKNIVDEAIIGGFVLETGNTRLDASIGTQLAEIRKKIVKTNKKIV